MNRTRVRYVAMWAALGLASLAGGGFQAAQTRARGPSREYARANKQKLEAYVMLLRLRHDLLPPAGRRPGKWPDDKEANAALAAHGEYWSKQLKAGRALLAGGMKGDYWDNAAPHRLRGRLAGRGRSDCKRRPGGPCLCLPGAGPTIRRHLSDRQVLIGPVGPLGVPKTLRGRRTEPRQQRVQLARGLVRCNRMFK